MHSATSILRRIRAQVWKQLQKDCSIATIEKSNFHPIVHELAVWVRSNPKRQQGFDQAIRTATSHGISGLEFFINFDSYLSFLSSILTWTPNENVDGTAIFDRFCKVYFILDQPSVICYQNQIYPGASTEKRTWLSNWIVRYNSAIGTHMDTPESLNETTLASFYQASKFRFDDYEQPEGGWKTFNEFFSRHIRRSKRPIEAPSDEAVWTSPADCTFVETFDITPDASIRVKTVDWSIAELLDGSPYAERFGGGFATHCFLGVFDYHRFHAPMSGTVVEAKRVSGSHYAQIDVTEIEDESGHASNETASSTEALSGQTTKVLRKRKVIDCPNEWGYQCFQSRGLVVLDTPHGLVGVIAVGMSVVSSVTLTAAVGETIAKGDEMGFFKFGGSDVIVLFERKPQITPAVGHHLLMGEEFGRWNL